MTEVIKLSETERKALNNAWQAAKGTNSIEAIKAYFEYQCTPYAAAERRKVCLEYAMKIADEGGRAIDIIEDAKMFECYLLDIDSLKAAE